MRTTLREYLHRVNVRGEDVDMCVDGIDCIAVCPPVTLTEKGRERFARALELEVTADALIIGDDKDYDDLDNYDQDGVMIGDGGRLNEAWMLLRSLGGWCAVKKYNEWIEGGEEL